MRGLATIALMLAAGTVSLLPFTALVGLGAHRHAAPWVVSAAAVALVYAPVLLSISAWHRDRAAGGLLSPATHGALSLLAWSLALFVVLPVYFPGERNDGMRTGLGLLGYDAGDWLPEEPAVSRPEVASAEVAQTPEPAARAPDLRPDQIALPYEGEGRRMSVPVAFENAGQTVELEMMFDTGATYTTLGTSDLAKLGRVPGDGDPEIELHTANGVRTARLVLLDHVWLGDLSIEGVAIAVCDDCGGGETAGLLGLNVTGGFNVGIDADRREVVFATRARFDRKLDVRPFTELDARFTRFPGGRVEVAVSVENRSSRPIAEVVAAVGCGDASWTVEVHDIQPGARPTERRKLPAHEGCEQYEIGLGSARW